MRYYIIAGEASGDLHASRLMREIKMLDAEANFRYWGGDLMKKQGGELVKHYRDLAFMGFTEVLLNLNTILSNIRFCKKDVLDYKPDAVILVDYPGFNLRIAEFVKTAGIPVYYYISPQVWAWKQSRVKKIRRVVDKMLVILPFEKDFYKKFDYEVEFVGHPLIDAITEERTLFPLAEEFRKAHGLDERPVILLLPGSRRQEIASMLPLMLGVIDDFPEYNFVIAGAPSIPDEVYKVLIGKKKCQLIKNQTYALLNIAHAALVTSGTATLETALFRVPEVVCYKGGRISYYIARSLVKIKYISLVNLIMDREVVRELIQDELTAKNLKAELSNILSGPTRQRLENDYEELIQKLGGTGASLNAARSIVNDLIAR